MFEKLILKNIQSHKDTEINFTTGVNSIVGSTCAGKSAILRALYWIIENRPSGTDILCSNWNKTDKGKIVDEMSATLYTDKGWVKRYRDNESNGYLVHYADGKEVKLEAVRTDVPSEVTQFLNLSDINVQKQLDAPFLLSMSAPESARYLNSIVHLDSIDVMLSKGESDKRKVNNNLKFVTEELEEKEKELEKFADLDKCQSLIERIEKFDNQAEELENEADELSNDIEQFSDVVDYTNHLELIAKIDEEISVIDTLNDSIDELSNEIEQFSDVVDYTNHLELIAKIESIEIEDDFEIEDDIEEYKKNLKLIAKFDEEIKELESQLPDVCPYCGAPINK